MIKRLVFDLDNTLIMWDSEFYKTLDKTLNYFNISYDDNVKNNLIKAVDDYESVYEILKFEYMNDLMKKYSNIDLPNNFVEKWTIYLENAIPLNRDLELIDTLEYLSNKYELVVLTNWFTKQQSKRLDNYGILKYFKEVIGTDLVKNKPNKEAFVKACGNNELEECIMIGDSLTKDVQAALNVGMKAILMDYKNIYDGEIIKVKKISDLKNIL